MTNFAAAPTVGWTGVKAVYKSAPHGGTPVCRSTSSLGIRILQCRRGSDAQI